MKIPVPKFIPIPSPEVMQTMSIIMIALGICLLIVGLIFFRLKKDSKTKKTTAYICMIAGGLLLVNHMIQLFIN